MSEQTVPPGTPPEERRRALWAHVVPFGAWLFLMHMLGDPAGWKYAVRSAACLGLLAALRPWRGYAAPRARNLLFALGAGVAVFVLLVGPESAWMDRLPALKDFYLAWAVTPLGRAPEPLKTFQYAPEVCGWAWSVARLLGSALVIAPVEEFFWRGFVYRWMIKSDFLAVDLRAFRAGVFLGVSFVFGLEHDRWLAGALAGMAYGWVMIRTGDVCAAAFAHFVTNFLLGLYVLAAGAYGFW